MTTYNITVKKIREIAADRGISHAEMVLEDCESQVGRDKLAKVRAELNRLMDAESRAE